jgi:hypothetical protein
MVPAEKKIAQGKFVFDTTIRVRHYTGELTAKFPLLY